MSYVYVWNLCLVQTLYVNISLYLITHIFKHYKMCPRVLFYFLFNLIEGLFLWSLKECLQFTVPFVIAVSREACVIGANWAKTGQSDCCKVRAACHFKHMFVALANGAVLVKFQCWFHLSVFIDFRHLGNLTAMGSGIQIHSTQTETVNGWKWSFGHFQSRQSD